MLSNQSVPRRSRGAALVVALAAGLAACSSGAGGADDTVTPPPKTAPSSLTVTFDEPDTLMLGLGDVQTLAITVAPPMSTEVRFALIGDHADAALSSTDPAGDPSSVTTDDQGHASIELHAPTSAATFAVRATTTSGGTALRAVSASGSGFGTIVVMPSYEGDREAMTWTATAAVGDSCANHPELPVNDGPISVTGDASSLSLTGVPAGTTVLVTLRSAYDVAACVDVGALSVNESRVLAISAENVPATLGSKPFDLQLGFSPDPAPWSALVAAWGERFRASFLGGAKASSKTSAGVRALLDTVALSLSVEEAAAFQAARVGGDWDDLVSQALGSSVDPAEALEAWLTPALHALETSPTGAECSATVTSSNAATFAPSYLLGLDTNDGDTLTTVSGSFGVGGNDVVQANGSFVFWPSRVIARGVLARLAAGSPASTDVPSALAKSVACSKLAGALVPGGDVIPGCGASCITTACETALGTMWTRATSTDELSALGDTFTFAASGQADVDENAGVTSFSGTWLGSVSEAPTGGTTTSVSSKGSLSAWRSHVSSP